MTHEAANNTVLSPLCSEAGVSVCAHALASNYKCRTAFASCTYPARRHRPANSPPLKKLSFLKYTGLCGTDTCFPDKYAAQAVMQFPHHMSLFRRKVEHRAIKEPI